MVVTVDQADKSIEMMTNTTAELIVYEGVGHMAVLEAPMETSRDIRAYLDARESGSPKDESAP